MAFHRVTAQLWVGGRMSAADWKELNDLGVTVCVNLRPGEPDRFGDRPPEAALSVPVPDGAMPNVDRLLIVAHFIAAAVREGRRVVVHSKAGGARAPLTVATYLVSTGLTLDAAMETLRQAGVDLRANAQQLGTVRDFVRAWRERQALEA